jgi:nuclease-like protein
MRPGPFRKPRFPGAGSSLDAEFNRQLRENVRNTWRVWLGFGLAIVGFAVWSGLAGGISARFLAAIAGGIGGMAFVVLAMGGHVSTYMWSLGAEGERMTGKEIEKLSEKDWHCEHSIKHAHGDWDHVLIGPPGIFLVDSKRLSKTAVVARDALHSGRLAFNGSLFRGGAWDVNKALEARLGRRAPFVTPVVAIWGDFPQEWVEEGEKPVVYVQGERIATWLGGLPEKLNAPERAALITALRQARAELAAADPA